MKLKITTDREIKMDGIESCTKIDTWDNRPIDYAYSYEENPTFNYFDLVINGEHKTLAVNGKVELIDIPVQENSVQIWDKKAK